MKSFPLVFFLFFSLILTVASALPRKSVFSSLIAKHLAALESKDPEESLAIQASYEGILTGYSTETLQEYIEKFNASPESFLSVYMEQFLFNQANNHHKSALLLQSLEQRRQVCQVELQKLQVLQDELFSIEKQIEFLLKFPLNFKKQKPKRRNSPAPSKQKHGKRSFKRSSTCSKINEIVEESSNLSFLPEGQYSWEPKTKSMRSSNTSLGVDSYGGQEELSELRRKWVSTVLNPVALSLFEHFEFSFERECRNRAELDVINQGNFLEIEAKNNFDLWDCNIADNPDSSDWLSKSLQNTHSAWPASFQSEPCIDWKAMFCDFKTLFWNEQNIQEFSERGLVFFEILLQNKDNFKRNLEFEFEVNTFNNLIRIIDSGNCEIYSFSELSEIISLADFLMLSNTQPLGMFIMNSFFSLSFDDFTPECIDRLPICGKIFNSFLDVFDQSGVCISGTTLIIETAHRQNLLNALALAWMNDSIEEIVINSTSLDPKEIQFIDNWLLNSQITSLTLKNNGLNEAFTMNNLSRLTKLSISRNPIGNSCALALINNLVEVQKLEFISCGLVDFEFGLNLKNLTSLKLNYNTLKTEFIVCLLNLNLETLGLTLTGTEGLFSGGPLSSSLKELDFSGSELEDASILADLSFAAPGLEVLNLQNTEILMVGILEEFKALYNFPALRELNLSQNILNCSSQAQEILAIFGNIETLKVLHIGEIDCVEDDDFIRGISLWKEDCALEELTIKLPNEGIETDYFMSIIRGQSKKLSNLKKICLSSPQFPSDATMAKIRELLPNLEHVFWKGTA